MIFRDLFRAAMICGILLLPIPAVVGQARIGSIQGVIKDPTGALLPDAKVTVTQPVTGYQQTTQTDAQGSFKLVNVPFNTYKIRVEAPGFQPTEESVDLHTNIPLTLELSLSVEETTAAVTITTGGAAMLIIDSLRHRADVPRDAGR